MSPKITPANDLKEYIECLARAAKKASVGLRSLSASDKNSALESIAQAIDAQRVPADQILARQVVARRQVGDLDTQCHLQLRLAARRCARVARVSFDAEATAVDRQRRRLRHVRLQCRQFQIAQRQIDGAVER